MHGVELDDPHLVQRPRRGQRVVDQHRRVQGAVDRGDPPALHTDADLGRSARHAPHEAKREVVEELVGQDAPGEVLVHDLEARDNADAADGELGQAGSGPWAPLHRQVARRNVAEGIEDLSRQGPVAGTDLQHPERGRPPQQVPHRPQGQAHELPEDRMDVRAGHEVAALADGGVLVEAAGAVQGDLHELGEGDRTVVLDGRENRIAHLVGHGPRVSLPVLRSARMPPWNQLMPRPSRSRRRR